jgi:hypothetical protein
MRPSEKFDFDGRGEFHAAALRLFGETRHTLVLLDRKLEDWPIESAAGEQALRSALVRGARLRILLGQTEWVERHAHRLLRLRRDFSERLDIRMLPPGLRLEESLLVVDRQHVLRRAHSETLRGSAVLATPSQAEAPGERFESAWQESIPCLPATTLGL